MKNDAYTRAVTEPRFATDRIPDTVRNHDGGAVFEIGDEAQTRRFLVIGTTGGTYYQGEREHTRENLDAVTRFVQAEPLRAAELIADISERGIAPKVDPQLFALAIMTAGTETTRSHAFAVFDRVVRTGSHLLMWARYHKALGGKVNRSWRRTVKSWYASREADRLSYQLAKYRQRDGWAQKDLIDMSHALSTRSVPVMRGDQAAALHWARGDKTEWLPDLLHALEQEDYSATDLIAAGASWEMLPDAELRKRETWAYLLESGKLPMTAALRNLPRMTELEVFDPYFGNAPALAFRRMFEDEDLLRKARIHPLSILLAIRQYAMGATRSGLVYRPLMPAVEVLNSAFYRAFETAPASGKRHLIGVDVSASMTMRTPIGLTSNEIAAVMAMKIMATEPASLAVGFAHELRELPFNRVTSLENACKATIERSFGATDPGLLFEYALAHKIEVDTFVVITDNEVNRGRHVPDQLRRYRRETGIPAKLAVLATTATNFSIADPRDPGMLDIAGFGSDVPALLAEFSRGF